MRDQQDPAPEIREDDPARLLRERSRPFEVMRVMRADTPRGRDDTHGFAGAVTYLTKG